MTSYPSIMSTGDKWAEDLTESICPPRWRDHKLPIDGNSEYDTVAVSKQDF